MEEYHDDSDSDDSETDRGSGEDIPRDSSEESSGEESEEAVGGVKPLKKGQILLGVHLIRAVVVTGKGARKKDKRKAQVRVCFIV
tara:strand:- start:680 stop:934 length:255 start_codon:yes stop_codon:yes gene_type:complete